MDKIKVGLIPSPDLPAKIVNKIVGQLSRKFQEQINPEIDWEIEVKVGLFVGAAEYINETIDNVVSMKEANNWDYAISITDLPSFSEHKAVIADINTKKGVGMISLPSFGAFPLKKKN